MEPSLDTSSGETVAVGAVVDGLGPRAHGTVLLLLALPNLIPLPVVPGSTTLFGSLIALVALQLLVGRPVLWLPARVRAHCLARDTAEIWLARAHGLTGRLCGADCPADNTVSARLVGALALVHGTLLALPIPFANFLPALAVACLGAGLAQSRRRPVLLALALTALTAAVVASASRWIVHHWPR